MGENRCVCCDNVIPEGMLICPTCRNSASEDDIQMEWCYLWALNKRKHKQYRKSQLEGFRVHLKLAIRCLFLFLFGKSK